MSAFQFAGCFRGYKDISLEFTSWFCVCFFFGCSVCDGFFFSIRPVFIAFVCTCLACSLFGIFLNAPCAHMFSFGGVPGVDFVCFFSSFFLFWCVGFGS